MPGTSTFMNLHFQRCSWIFQSFQYISLLPHDSSPFQTSIFDGLSHGFPMERFREIRSGSSRHTFDIFDCASDDLKKKLSVTCLSYVEDSHRWVPLNIGEICFTSPIGIGIHLREMAGCFGDVIHQSPRVGTSIPSPVHPEQSSTLLGRKCASHHMIMIFPNMFCSRIPYDILNTWRSSIIVSPSSALLIVESH